jgi:hypothetical protein
MTGSAMQTSPHAVSEREITTRVDLCLPDGRLDPAAVGWSRVPLHRANIRGWGRTMRWDYWCVTSEEMVFAFSASSLDYLAGESAWFLDRRTGEQVSSRGLLVPARGVSFSERCGEGSVRIGAGPVRIAVDETAAGTRLRLKSAEFEADLLVHRVPGRESLSLVVPWSPRRFQYTVKDVGRPAEGTVRVNGRTRTFAAGALATLDLGRGRWPSPILWNWGAGAGRPGGRDVAVQVGGKWTDGTGSVENALILDGRVHKISEELVWRYDTSDWYAPWRITGERADLEFVPEHVRLADVRRAVYMRSREAQAFGHYRGTVVADDGESVAIDGLYGWAEEVFRRW